MYKVEYLDKDDNVIEVKVGFTTSNEANEWIKTHRLSEKVEVKAVTARVLFDCDNE